MIRIEPVSKENALQIYNFELANRQFFESHLPPRGEQYYELEHFMHTIALICEDQASGQLYMNIILNEANEMVGRVNLFPVDIPPYSRAFELGYRIGEDFQGRGYATQAAGLLIEKAQTLYGIDVLQAATSPENVKSQQVLIKNGFHFVKRIENDIEYNGQFEDSLLYYRVLKPVSPEGDE